MIFWRKLVTTWLRFLPMCSCSSPVSPSLLPPLLHLSDSTSLSLLPPFLSPFTISRQRKQRKIWIDRLTWKHRLLHLTGIILSLHSWLIVLLKIVHKSNKILLSSLRPFSFRHPPSFLSVVFISLPLPSFLNAILFLPSFVSLFPSSTFLYYII